MSSASLPDIGTWIAGCPIRGKVGSHWKTVDLKNNKVHCLFPRGSAVSKNTSN